ncbi:MAG: hypothetical protein M5U28_43995 [Sandaracinaceae bacterium]|nr:hypothetical protein [Sandaracinaceae bacterium]
MLGESREGRPIKIEGNPAHPFSLGAAGPREQALPFTLYDSGRLGSVTYRGEPSTFEAFARAMAQRPFAARHGEGLHLFCEATTSPSMEALLDRIAERFPRASVWLDPSSAPLAAWEGARRVFGRPLTPLYRFDRADRVLALDADLLNEGPGALRWARQWAARRAPAAAMSRCYAVDATPTGTSIAFDHRAIARPSEIGAMVAGLLAALGAADRAWLERAPHAGWIEVVARDLARHRRRSLVVCGERQPAHVHALVWCVNAALESVGETVALARPPWRDAGSASVAAAPLLDALDAGEVDTLVVLGGNPAYTTPGFAARARRAEELVALAQYPHETARLASWTIPELHPLERWGDARSLDGTLTTIQPLVRPLFGGQAPESVLLALLGEPQRLLRDRLIEGLSAAGHDPRAVLARGFVPGSAHALERAEVSLDALAPALAELAPPISGLELDLRPDPRIEDGALAENAWLEELPELTTKLVWDNAALVAPEDASALGLARGDVVELRTAGGALRVPVLAVEGQARGTVTLWLGFGRRDGGRAARAVGVDTGTLRRDGWWAPVSLRATGERRELATTQHDFELPRAEVPIAVRRTLREHARDPSYAQRWDRAHPRCTRRASPGARSGAWPSI